MSTPERPFDPTDSTTWREVMAVREVAAVWDVSEDQVRTAIREGKLVATSLSTRTTRVTKASLLRLMGEAPPDPPGGAPCASS